MDSLDEILRKSNILTHHSPIISKHHLSLPSLHSSVEYLPSPKQPGIKNVSSTKNKMQMAR
jgi:hypothetical protein